jgi:hypothetical protein
LVVGFIARPLLWRYRLRAALLVTFVAAIFASILIIRSAALKPHKRSPFGRYVERYMTKGTQDLQLAGCLIMMVGVWYRRPSLAFLGLLAFLVG